MAGKRSRTALTLIELLITIALISILAALVLPKADPAVRDQLVSASQVLAGDLAYGRSLAVTNNTNFRYTFDLDSNSYTLEHNKSPSPLPNSLFDNPTSPASTQYRVSLAQLPHVGASVSLYAVGTVQTGRVSPVTAIDCLVFGPEGGLVDPDTEIADPRDVVVWLAAGQGTSRRYINLVINGATGLVTPGDYGGTPPVVSKLR